MKKMIISMMCVIIMISTVSIEVNAANFSIPAYLYSNTDLYSAVDTHQKIITMQAKDRVDIDSTNYNEQLGLGWMYVKHAASGNVGFCDAHALRL